MLYNRTSVKWSVDDMIRKMDSLPSLTLLAEDAKRFIDLVYDESVLKGHAQTIAMSTNTKRIHGLGLSSTMLHPEPSFTQSNYVSTFETDTITLEAKEMRGAIIIKDADLEDLNIGSEAEFKSTVMKMAAKKIANELEFAAWLSDKQSLSGYAATDINSLTDGWRYRLDHSQSGETYENSVSGSTTILDASNTVTAKAESYRVTTSKKIVEMNASAPYRPEVKLAAMLRRFPSKYKQDGIDKLRFFMNDQVASEYMEFISERNTNLGDAAMLGQAKLTYARVPIVEVPLMSRLMVINGSDAQKENYNATSGTLTDVLLTRSDNLVIGIQKDIIMEPERSARDRGTYFYFTIRADYCVVDVAAAVLLKRVE